MRNDEPGGGRGAHERRRVDDGQMSGLSDNDPDKLYSNLMAEFS